LEQIDVKILGREYKLAVQPEEKNNLLDAVKMVDERMRSIREAGRVSGLDRIAVMAALQLAHELLAERRSDVGATSADVRKRIQKLTTDLDHELKRQESLF
jgi:cell division protein ZapA